MPHHHKISALVKYTVSFYTDRSSRQVKFFLGKCGMTSEELCISFSTKSGSPTAMGYMPADKSIINPDQLLLWLEKIPSM